MVRTELSEEEKRKKREALDNSRDLYAWRISDYPEVKSALQHIFNELNEEEEIGKRYKKKWRDHVRVIVLDLFVANRSDPEMYITYSRNSNDYRPRTKYSSMFLSYDITIKIIDFLIKNRWIENIPGAPKPPKRKRPRMRADKKLIRLLKDKYGAELGMIKWDETEPVLILRDEEGKDIDFEDDDDTIQMKENLKLINENLQKEGIFLYIWDEDLKIVNYRLSRNFGKEVIDFSRKRVRRIFNNGCWNQGGRFYGGWWQNIPRECRKYIRLNDKDVVEPDFSGLHVNMLYAIEKLPMPVGDVYELDGYSNDNTFREFVKKVLQAMVNAPYREKARKGIHKSVHKKKDLELPPEIGSTKGKDIFPIMDAFEKKHDKIKHYFCTGKGIDLQYLDSQMAEKVMLHFAKMGYAILPMHDSFIIHHGLENELREAMEKAFFDLFNVNCEVDLKYSSIIVRQKQEQEEGEPQGPCNYSLKEIFEEEANYSVYWQLLEEHRKHHK